MYAQPYPAFNSIVFSDMGTAESLKWELSIARTGRGRGQTSRGADQGRLISNRREAVSAIR